MREDDLWRGWMKLSVSQNSMHQRLEAVMITVPDNKGAGRLVSKNFGNKKGPSRQAFVRSPNSLNGRFLLLVPQVLYQVMPRWQISAMSHRAQRRPCRPD